MAKTRLEIRGMSCQHCVKTVTDALTTLEGVQRVKVRRWSAMTHPTLPMPISWRQ